MRQVFRFFLNRAPHMRGWEIFAHALNPGSDTLTIVKNIELEDVSGNDPIRREVFHTNDETLQNLFDELYRAGFRPSRPILEETSVSKAKQQTIDVLEKQVERYDTYILNLIGEDE